MSLLSTHFLGLSLLPCQETTVFWFHGCSYHPQWFWSPRRGNLSILPPFPLCLLCSYGTIILILKKKKYLVLSQLFHFLLWPLLRGSLAPLHFLPLGWYHPHIWSSWCFSCLSWFQLVTHPAQQYIRVYIFLKFFFPVRWLYNIEQSSLCYNSKSLLAIHFKYSSVYTSIGEGNGKAL